MARSRSASPSSAWALMAARLGGLNLKNRRVPYRPVHILSQVRLCSNHSHRLPPQKVYRPPKKAWLTFLFRTATMVQGPSDAVVVASFPGQLDYSLSCAIKSSMANCVGEIVANANGMTLTTSLQEPVKPYLVQGGGSGSWSPPAPTPPPNGSGSNSSSEGVNGSPASTSTVMQRVGLLVGSVVVGAAAFFLV